MSLGIDDFLQEQVEATKALIVAYNAAILALTTGAQSYQLDTGQTRQLVTKANLATLINARDRLLNELSVMGARFDGDAAFRMNPSW